jgi:uncharacterized membrane protein YkoI
MGRVNGTASHGTLRISTYYSSECRKEGGDGLHARAIKRKTWLVVAVAALLLLVGAGVAYATGGDSSAQPTGSNIEKAKSIALDQTSGGHVTGTEVGDEEGYYEVEVIREDGSQVDVHLDRDFHVLTSPADNENPDDKDAPGDSGG